MLTDEKLLDYIEQHRLYNEFEDAVREDMLGVFDEYYSASEFATEEFFSEKFLWNPNRWTNDVRLKILRLIDVHDSLLS